MITLQICGQIIKRMNASRSEKRKIFLAQKASGGTPAKSGPRVIGYADNAGRRSCAISFLRNVGSSYSEESGVEDL
jgi:hypothetical protein